MGHIAHTQGTVKQGYDTKWPIPCPGPFLCSGSFLPVRPGPHPVADEVNMKYTASGEKVEEEASPRGVAMGA